MTLSGLWFGHTGLSEERQGNTECGYIHWSSYSSWKIPSVTAAGQSKSTEKRSRAECAQTCWKWKRMWDENKECVKEMRENECFCVPLWHCGGDRNRPLLWPGSRSHPSAWSHVCLWEGRKERRKTTRVWLKDWNVLTTTDFFLAATAEAHRLMSPRISTGRRHGH